MLVRQTRLVHLLPVSLPIGSWLGVEITCRVYKPRRPRESPLFRLVEQHIEERSPGAAGRPLTL